jgi:hypothetical protein
LHPLGGYPKRLGWRRTWIYYGGSKLLGVGSLQIQMEWLQFEWVKTLRVLASIYKPNRLRNGRLDKSTRG